MPVRLIATTVLILAATIFCGFVQGKWTYRWGAPNRVVAESALVSSVPKTIGPWRMVSDNPVSEKVLETLQCTGHLFRTYVNDETQQQVQVAILIGPAGPISVHTPEICYSSLDFEQTEVRRAVSIDPSESEETSKPNESSASTNEFWALPFRTTDVHAAPMSVFYAWSAGQEWQATDQPRHSFAGVPNLYKIQLSALMPGAGVLGTSSDPCYSFLQDFLKTAWPLKNRAS